MQNEASSEACAPDPYMTLYNPPLPILQSKCIVIFDSAQQRHSGVNKFLSSSQQLCPLRQTQCFAVMYCVNDVLEDNE